MESVGFGVFTRFELRCRDGRLVPTSGSETEEAVLCGRRVAVFEASEDLIDLLVLGLLVVYSSFSGHEVQPTGSASVTITGVGP